MKLTINTTDEQDEALAALNAKSNPKNPPAIEDFSTSLLNSTLDGITEQNKQDQLEHLKSKLQKVSAEDLAQIKAVTDKYSAG